VLEAFDIQCNMIYNLQTNIVQSIEDANRSRGSAHVTDGSVDASISSPPGNTPTTEPAGFNVFLTRSTRQYARITVLDNPGALSLFLDSRLDIHSLFIVFMETTASSPEMLAHLKDMCKTKVRNTSLPPSTRQAINTEPLFRVVQLSKIILTACREVRTDLHGIVKVLLPLMLSQGESTLLSRENNDIAQKILTGRAAFGTHTNGADEDVITTALERSVTKLLVLVVTIATVAHKSLCTGKRRLTNDRELTFANTHLRNFSELFDPHLEPGMSAATVNGQWVGTKDQVQAAILPHQADFGLTPRTVHSSKPLTGELVVYTWYNLLHEAKVWGTTQRIDSTGTSGDRNYCVQVCLQNAFLDVINKHKVGCWFDIDPVAVQVRKGAIAIHTPGVQSLECARNYMRGMRILPAECNIANLNQLQALRSGVFILDKNCTDLLPPTNGPWSDQMLPELHAGESEPAFEAELHAGDDERASHASDDDEGDDERSDAEKRSAHTAGLSEDGSVHDGGA